MYRGSSRGSVPSNWTSPDTAHCAASASPPAGPAAPFCPAAATGANCSAVNTRCTGTSAVVTFLWSSDGDDKERSVKVVPGRAGPKARTRTSKCITQGEGYGKGAEQVLSSRQP